jgi:hypothetical protein
LDLIIKKNSELSEPFVEEAIETGILLTWRIKLTTRSIPH